MRTLAIGGCASGSGKTTLIERLIPLLPGWGVLKTSPGRHGGVADGGWSLVKERERLEAPGSDTQRYLDAGAERVAWLRSRGTPPPAVREAVAAHFLGLAGLVFEGNAAAAVLGASRTYVVIRAGRVEIKPSALEALHRAIAVLVNVPSGVSMTSVHESVRAVRAVCPGARLLSVDLRAPGDPALDAWLSEISTWSRS